MFEHLKKFKIRAKKPSKQTLKNKETALNLTQYLNKTRQMLGDKLRTLLIGKNTLSAELLEALETTLIRADIAINTTDKIISELKKISHQKNWHNKEDLYNALRKILSDTLITAKPLNMSDIKPFVILVVGVNGAGKTTTIAKLAQLFKAEGKSVILAAGDTFRAAAIEQLKIWGVRSGVRVIAQKIGADPASVIYDALISATAKDIDVLIADTAGRLHTQHNLMSELKKIKRTLAKNLLDAPHEIMLIVDSNSGQNALNQAREFHQKIGVNSISITKLDGSAKGGVVFSICDELSIPIRYITTGETNNDLSVFDKTKFIAALL